MENDTTILIVDDAISCRQPLAVLLRSLGYEPICASNGVEAMRVLEHQTPCAILLDINMPQMDGITLLRMMQAHSAWKHIPVIVLSASTDKTTVVAAAGLGVREYVVKNNYSMTDLLARLDRHVAPAVAAATKGPIESSAGSIRPPDLAGDFEAPSGAIA